MQRRPQKPEVAGERRPFRVHYHDGTSVDIQAGNSLIAERDARKLRPEAGIRKIKLIREKGHA